MFGKMPKFAGLIVFQYVSEEGKARLYNEELHLIEADTLAKAEEEYSRRIEQGISEGISLYKAFKLQEVQASNEGLTLLFSRRFDDLERYGRSIMISDL